MAPAGGRAGQRDLLWLGQAAARAVDDPDEVPISLITALLSALFFLYLLCNGHL
ncbi:iron ABC transporter permease [Salinispora arenicola]|uniref:hypothetical protein n=1 Tax=Salinispora arenicola TaxID=168697 RepID=UPI000378D863|nr:hypothetical protein [Salinispora arenicola]NIL44140.1 iron ABC transporter permease [Salinispora arenicola]